MRGTQKGVWLSKSGPSGVQADAEKKDLATRLGPELMAQVDLVCSVVPVSGQARSGGRRLTVRWEAGEIRVEVERQTRA